MLRHLTGPLAGTTALVLSLANVAHAETTIQLNPQKVAQLTTECQGLVDALGERDNTLPDDLAREVIAAINADDPDACGDLEQSRITAMGTDQDLVAPQDEVTRAEAVLTDGAEEETIPEATDAQVTEAETEVQTDRTQTETTRVTDEVEIQQEATITGQAQVRVPAPQVDAQVPAPEITVHRTQPQVSITEEAAQIEVMQAQPTIEVEIPEIVVRVQIPAPRVYVRTGQPDVSVSADDPRVEVQQGEPVITVRQGEPTLDVDLGVDSDEQRADAETDAPLATGANRTQMADTTQGDTTQGNATQMAGSNAEVTTSRADTSEPKITFLSDDAQPQVDLQNAQPEFIFQQAEPKISVIFAEQPTIELARAGEPEITFETAEERAARRNQDQQKMAALSGDDATMATDGRLTVDQLLSYDIVGADGESLGRAEAIVELAGQLHLIVRDPGFLGLGVDQAAVPLTSVTVRDGQIQVAALTEDQMDEAGRFDYDSSQTLPGDHVITLR